MTLPAPLTREDGYMALYSLTTMGMTDGERHQVDVLIELAFGKGEIVGMGEAIRKVKGDA